MARRGNGRTRRSGRGFIMNGRKLDGGAVGDTMFDNGLMGIMNNTRRCK